MSYFQRLQEQESDLEQLNPFTYRMVVFAQTVEKAEPETQLSHEKESTRGLYTHNTQMGKEIKGKNFKRHGHLFHSFP